MLEEMKKVKVGDIINCTDEYGRDGEIHQLRVQSIEEDEEGNIQLFGEDLTYPDDDELGLGCINAGGFVDVYLSIDRIFKDIKFQYSRAANQTANMFSSEHTKFSCKMTYNGKSYQSNYQCNENYSDMNNIKVDFLSCVFADMNCYDCSRDKQNFASNIGLDYWEDRAEVNRCYNACKRASERMNEIFDYEELESLKTFFNNY